MRFLIIPVMLLFIEINTSKAQTTFTGMAAMKHCDKYIIICDSVFKFELIHKHTRLLHFGSQIAGNRYLWFRHPSEIWSPPTYLQAARFAWIVRFNNGRNTLFTSKKLMHMGPIAIQVKLPLRGITDMCASQHD